MIDFATFIRKTASSSAWRVCALAIVFAALAAAAIGQTVPPPISGFTPIGIAPGAPVGSYPLSGFDNVNLYNGNLNVHLPLLQVGGRGGAAYSMMLSVEVRWLLNKFVSCEGGGPCDVSYGASPNWWSAIRAGYGPGILQARFASYEEDLNPCRPVSGRIRSLARLTFFEPDGSEHELIDVLSDGEPKFTGCASPNGGPNWPRGTVFRSYDGTSMTYISNSPVNDAGTVATNGRLMFRDGTRCDIQDGVVTRIRDRNGNVLTFLYEVNQGHFTDKLLEITDSLNRKIHISYHTNTTSDPFDQITFDGFGATRTIKVKYSMLGSALAAGETLQTYDDLFPGPDVTVPNSEQFNREVVSELQLPNVAQSGSVGRYVFRYNSYSEVAKIELPTGGRYEYFWAPGSGTLDGGVVAGPAEGPHGEQSMGVYRRVTEKRIFKENGTEEGRMKFLDSYNAPTNSTIVTLQHRGPGTNGPVLAQDKHYFLGDPGTSQVFGSGVNGGPRPTDYSPWDEGIEYKTELLDMDTNATVLQAVENTYEGRRFTWSNAGLSNDSHLIETITTIDPTLSTRLVTKRNSINPTDPSDIGFDAFNNPTDIWEYDFGQGSVGPLIRHTQTEYVSNNPESGGPNYQTNTDIHIRSLPKRVSVFDNGQTERSCTTYEYDNYTVEVGTNPNHAALVTRTNISGHDDAVFSDSRLERGNVTSVTRRIDSSASTSTFQFYDVAGNVVKTKDPLGKLTTFDYADRFGTPGDDEARGNTPPSNLDGDKSFAFVTKVTNALNHDAYTQYDYNLGKPVNSEDQNQVVASLYYESGTNTLDRPVRLVSAANFSAVRTQTTITYDDLARTITTSSDLTTFQDGLTSAAIYDGLGRTVETRKSEPGGPIATTQSYDAMGRPLTASNPFRANSEDTYGTTVTSYDVLSRVSRVQTFDKNGTSTGVVTTDYLANKVTVTDQAERKRRSVADALGRLIRVDEPDATTGNLDNGTTPVQPTNYSYDVLGNLTQVTQQSGATTQTRRFAYDQMSRLIFAANPEQNTSTDPLFTYNSQQWAVRYEYDAASNLKFKTDTRKPGEVFVKVTYVYDDLHRLTTRSYTDGTDGTPPVNYSYDTATYGVGRLASVSASGVSTTSYAAYDQLGGPLDYSQQTAGQTYSMHRTYNRAGLTITETYPSLKIFETEYDSAGRIAGVSRGGNYYAGAQASDATNRIHYSPAGAVDKLKLGNGLWEHSDFNSRLQPKLIGLGATATTSGTLQLEYDYGSSSNNGNVLSQKITAPTGAGNLLLTETYTYDKLNRLLTANEKVNQEASARWTQTFSFDRWGNRTGLTNTGELPPANQLAVTPATNRFSALLYDEAGNQLSDESSHPLNYDAENHQKSFTSGAITYNYSYDGDGRRVKREYNDGTTHTTVTCIMRADN